MNVTNIKVYERFAKLLVILNLGSDSLATMLERHGLLENIEHERVLRNALLNQSMVEEYLLRQNLKDAKIFPPEIRRRVGFEVQSLEYLSFNEVKTKIKEHNAIVGNSQISFEINVDDLKRALNINREVLAKTLLALFPELPVQFLIKPTARISLNTIRQLCKYEGISFEKYFPANNLSEDVSSVLTLLKNDISQSKEFQQHEESQLVSCQL